MHQVGSLPQTWLEWLDPVAIPEAMCSKLLESKVHENHSVLSGVCNILLPLVQSVVPVSKGAQQKLNDLLFGQGEINEYDLSLNSPHTILLKRVLFVRVALISHPALQLQNNHCIDQRI